MENDTIKSGEDSKFPNKKSLIIGGIIVIVVFIGLVVLANTKQKDSALVEGCESGDKFSQTTGKSCDGDESDATTPCKEGDKYNIVTGEACGPAN